MLLLVTALEAIERALRALDMAGPGRSPGHQHWQEARMLLTAAGRELEKAIELWQPPGGPRRSPNPEATS
jgi:hypothetical protein